MQNNLTLKYIFLNAKVPHVLSHLQYMLFLLLYMIFLLFFPCSRGLQKEEEKKIVPGFFLQNTSFSKKSNPVHLTGTRQTPLS